MSQARSDSEQLRNDISTLQDEDATVALVADLRKELADLQTKTDSLESQLSSTNDFMAWHRNRHDSLTRELRQKTAEADALRTDIRSCQAAFALVLEASKTPSVIESQIDGEFEGWEGETVFKLMNGQIWQQASYDYTYHYAYMPDVLIYETSGGYKMQVDGVGETIFVTRIR